MPITLTYLGHSGFLVSDGTYTVAIDPFLTGNPLARHKPDEIDCTHIALTHGHEDHFGDTIPIARRTGATVFAAFEICTYLGEQGIDKVEPGNPGGKIVAPFGWVAFTKAFHSSSYKGRYMGMPCGVVLNIGGVTLYHCGDTAIFGDMKIIRQFYTPHIAMIPVGDRFTMGPAMGAKAAELIQPQVAIPIHYKTFPLLVDDISTFKPTGVEVKVMEPGEEWQYGR
jgi:L-ascorbate metabolism protein UlaG (beta-lactamase superfamily)